MYAIHECVVVSKHLQILKAIKLINNILEAIILKTITLKAIILKAISLKTITLTFYCYCYTTVTALV